MCVLKSLESPSRPCITVKSANKTSANFAYQFAEKRMERASLALMKNTVVKKLISNAEDHNHKNP